MLLVVIMLFDDSSDIIDKRYFQLDMCSLIYIINDSLAADLSTHNNLINSLFSMILSSSKYDLALLQGRSRRQSLCLILICLIFNIYYLLGSRSRLLYVSLCTSRPQVTIIEWSTTSKKTAEACADI